MVYWIWSGPGPVLLDVFKAPFSSFIVKGLTMRFAVNVPSFHRMLLLVKSVVHCPKKVGGLEG